MTTDNPTRLPISRKLLERFFSKIHIDPTITWNDTPCWLWSNYINDGGYACFWNGKSTTNAHRIAYQLFVEVIPVELQCDHLCRIRHCVNPAHLEAVPPRINGLRGTGPQAINAKKTHCDNGHEFTPENTYIPPAPYNWRQCRLCRNERDKIYYSREQEGRTHITHCRNGHLRTPENTAHEFSGHRRCLDCRKIEHLKNSST